MATSPDRVTVEQLLRVLRAEKHNLANLEREFNESEDFSWTTAAREEVRYRRPLWDSLERADVRRFKRDCIAAGYSFDADGASQWVAQICKHNGLDLRNVEEMNLDDFCNLVEKPGGQPSPFVPTPLQRAILDALNGQALKKDALAKAVCGGDDSRLYKAGGLKELRERGLIEHKHGVGYYRPDAPPTL